MWEILKNIQDAASELGETASDVAGKVASTTIGFRLEVFAPDWFS